jgi:hypothetical protein
LENLKKARIPVSDIPIVDAENKYIIRYRVISEDKNRVSHWSQFLKIPGPPINPVGYTGAINVSIEDISISWFDSPRRGAYDIFIRYGNALNPLTPAVITWGQYAYSGTSTSQSFVVLNGPTTAGFIGVLVQVSGNKTINSLLKIYEDSASLRAEIDGGDASGV